MSEKCIRISVVIAAIYTLLQGLLWSGVAIYVVSVFTCHTPVPFAVTETNTTGYLFYLAYLKGHCQGYEPKSAGRTFIFMMVYSILSSIWIPTAVLLLVAVLKSVKGRHTKYFYLPWIMTSFGIAILDLVATIIYAIDISKTLTASDFQSFVDPNNMMKLHITGVDGVTVVPAAIMTVFFSRGIVLWIVNAFLLGFAIQGMLNNSRKNPNHRRHQETQLQESHNLKTIDEINKSRQRWINPSDGPGGARRYANLNPGQDNQGFIEEEEWWANRRFSGQEGPMRIEPTVIQVRPESRAKGGNSRAVDAPEVDGDIPPAIKRMVFDVNGKPTDERMTPPHMRNDKGLITPNKGLSGYSRPWSYTQPQIDSVPIKQAQADIEKPPIPVPDYSVRIKK